MYASLPTYTRGRNVGPRWGTRNALHVVGRRTPSATMEVEALLRRARNAANTPLGTTNELNSKALLALNLRKLGDGHLGWVPRSYVVVPPGTDQDGCSEFDEFVNDFRVSSKAKSRAADPAQIFGSRTRLLKLYNYMYRNDLFL